MRVPRCCTLLLIHTLLLALLLIGVNAKSVTGDRVLVIHEEDSIQSEFSQFFDSLKGTPSYLPKTAILTLLSRSRIPIDVPQSKTRSISKSDKVRRKTI